MNTRQKRLARRGVIAGLKRQLPVLLGFVVFFIVLGLIGHSDVETLKLEAASNTCRYQTSYSIPTFDQCMANQAEANSDN